MTGVGEYSASRLRDYASAWRATGCGCGDCSQCAARDLTAKEADEIAECIDTLRRELFRMHEWQRLVTPLLGAAKTWMPTKKCAAHIREIEALIGDQL